MNVKIAPNALELCLEVRRMLMAEIAVFFKCGDDQRLETRRDRRVDVCDGVRRAIQNRIEDNRLRAAAERLNPRRHLIEHDAKREEVGACIDLLTSRLFWRHV